MSSLNQLMPVNWTAILLQTNLEGSYSILFLMCLYFHWTLLLINFTFCFGTAVSLGLISNSISPPFSLFSGVGGCGRV
jgi:hypothetical protein